MFNFVYYFADFMLKMINLEKHFFLFSYKQLSPQ